MGNSTYKKRAELGLCIECGKAQVDTPGSRCFNCRRDLTEDTNGPRRERRSEGNCPYCGDAVIPGAKTCRVHAFGHEVIEGAKNCPRHSFGGSLDLAFHVMDCLGLSHQRLWQKFVKGVVNKEKHLYVQDE
ncbi:MAG: hypothetical protein WBV46_09380 [Terriglobales bacterium]